MKEFEDTLFLKWLRKHRLRVVTAIPMNSDYDFIEKTFVVTLNKVKEK